MLKPLLRHLHRPIYERRIEVLKALIIEHLRAGDRVLDVGCGSGALGRAILDSPAVPAGVTVGGAEVAPRPGALIEVTAYDGKALPFEDASFDVVIVADVLHHEREPAALLRECGRVSRRLLFIKDHKVEGPLAHPRISLIDWAANAGYGVECLFRYETLSGWRSVLRELGLTVVEERTSMDLYPIGFNLLFGRRLQYCAVCRVPHAARATY